VHAPETGPSSGRTGVDRTHRGRHICIVTTTIPPAHLPWTALVHSTRDRSRLHQKLARSMMQTVDRWKLVVPGDKILVAISGGKDSYALVDLLWEAKRRAPFAFDLVAVHLDQAQPGYDGRPLVQWLEASGVPFEVLREDTYSIVKDKTEEGQAYCFLCARLRRGILYSAAERLGCNKLALGHHRDDALETLLMNLCYAGKMQAMPARYTTDDGKLEVIRPLIDIAESDLRAFSVERAYPILPCNLCGSQDGLKRDAMATLLDTLETTIPNVRRVMHHAISNVRPTHLLDPEVREAWDARPAHVRPTDTKDSGPRRMTGAVVVKGGALPILNDGA
jgi:tRNA 2-thiocytidine biosynthesis protein TtcA